MPSTDRKLELKAKTSVAQTGFQPYVYAKGLIATSGTSVLLLKAPGILTLWQQNFLSNFSTLCI
jgi:hypothetical protein